MNSLSVSRMTNEEAQSLTTHEGQGFRRANMLNKHIQPCATLVSPQN